MSTHTPPPASVASPIEYPDRDGKPMSDNTLQFRWIVTIQGGLAALFGDRPDVFVAGDLLWYPVEGDNRTRTAPDAMVAFGRPPGDRGSYMQWVEDGIAPQVVFEVLSPGNRRAEMSRKRAFYDRFGVEEYYLYDPARMKLRGWIRRDDHLEPIAEMDGWVSPRLGIRFVMAAELEIYRPDGGPFLDFVETDRRMRESERRRVQAEQQADQERRLRIQSDRIAEAERERAEAERQQRVEAELKAARLLEMLREMGVDPDRPG